MLPKTLAVNENLSKKEEELNAFIHSDFAINNISAKIQFWRITENEKEEFL